LISFVPLNLKGIFAPETRELPRKTKGNRSNYSVFKMVLKKHFKMLWVKHKRE